MTELWTKAKDRLSARLSKQNFEAWIDPIVCDSPEDGKLLLRVPNAFFRDWLLANYEDLLVEALNADLSKPLKLELEVDESLQAVLDARNSVATPQKGTVIAPSVVKSEPRVETGGSPPDAGLARRYSFENFVVGPSNELAHAACIAAAKHPGSRYNPLFLYGGVGLGKTHLVNAAGLAICDANPSTRLLYVSAEHFTNEFIHALQTHQIGLFRKRYREQCDVLLMDDIQFLAGREQTQEEFFHTFNALYHLDKQIIVTSDVNPQHIPEMQERLISRFQSGLVADVQAPELDTRIAILKKKAEAEEIALPDDVALFVAQKVQRNVRELEGSLLRLFMRADLLKRPLDIDLARQTLEPMLKQIESILSIEDVQRAVCEHFRLRMSDLRSKRRARNIAYPRMLAMYLCREELGTSYPELGRRFGGKDHTTALSAVRKICSLIDKGDSDTKEALDAISRRLAC